MKNYFITFRSITYAQRAEKILINNGIPCHIRRTPRWMEERGCGYCLRIRPTQVAASLHRLKEGGVPFSKVYTRRADGSVEEMSL